MDEASTSKLSKRCSFIAVHGQVSVEIMVSLWSRFTHTRQNVASVILRVLCYVPPHKGLFAKAPPGCVSIVI